MTVTYSGYVGLWSITFLSAWGRRENEFSAHRVADHADQVETEPHATARRLGREEGFDGA